MKTTITERIREQAAAALTTAETALANADAQALFNQVKEAQKHEGEMAQALDAILAAYPGATQRPVRNDENAIAAMRDVALAAVELAKAVVGRD